MVMQKWEKVLVISTVILALVTFCYLLETRKQRLLFEKIVTVDTKPKVFIKTINTKSRADFERNQVVINSELVFTNCGKVEARNIVLSYVIFSVRFDLLIGLASNS